MNKSWIIVLTFLVVGAWCQNTTDESTGSTADVTEDLTTTPGDETTSTPVPPPVPYGIDISGGPIEGETIKGEHKFLSVFLGIPYAEPPVGSLRWKDTKKKTPWNETMSTKQYKPNCPQAGVSDYDEDCLFANVWTPKTNTTNDTTSYPVIVWFHGGRFETGGSKDSKYHGENLVGHQDVVVSTFNYRLGALGFMFFLGEEFTGNYGIKDQRMFLLWLSENVENFGGNRRTVTLMGTDAGAASIGFLMLDPTMKNLFERAIMLGGSPMMPWTLTDDRPVMADISDFYSRFALGCSSDNQTERRECLEQVNLTTIVERQRNFNTFFSGLEFAPNIDKETVIGDPWDRIPKGQFEARDLVIGVTNSEGGPLAERNLRASNLTIQNVTNEELYKMINGSLQWYPRIPKQLTNTGQTFLKLHFTQYSDPDNGERNFKEVVQAISDWYLTCPSVRMARDTEQNDPRVYLYYFTEPDTPGHDRWEGASHEEDVVYAFGIPTGSGLFYNLFQQILSEKMMGYFVDFAKTGKVPSSWPALKYKDEKEFNYYEFNANASVVGPKKFGYRLNECHWWTNTLSYVNRLVNGSDITTTTMMPNTTMDITGTIEPTTMNGTGTSTATHPTGETITRNSTRGTTTGGSTTSGGTGTTTKGTTTSSGTGTTTKGTTTSGGTGTTTSGTTISGGTTTTGSTGRTSSTDEITGTGTTGTGPSTPPTTGPQPTTSGPPIGPDPDAQKILCNGQFTQPTIIITGTLGGIQVIGLAVLIALIVKVKSLSQVSASVTMEMR